MLLKSQPINKMAATYRELINVHRQVIETVIFARGAVARLSQEERVDAALVLKLLSQLGDDVRKECFSAEKLFAQTTCAVWAQQQLTDPSLPDKIIGEIASGTPDVRIAAQLPHKTREPEQYAAFARWCGLSDDGIARGIMHPHWPSVSAVVTELMQLGRPLPDGIPPERTFAEYRLNPLRRLKNAAAIEATPAVEKIDEDSEAYKKSFQSLKESNQR